MYRISIIIFFPVSDFYNTDVYGCRRRNMKLKIGERGQGIEEQKICDNR